VGRFRSSCLVLAFLTATAPLVAAPVHEPRVAPSPSSTAVSDAAHRGRVPGPWPVRFGDRDNDFGIDVTTDWRGRIYVLGQFLGTIDVAPGKRVLPVTSSDYRDSVVAILGPRGQWQGHILIPDECQAMAWSPGGNLVLAGYFYSSADFDPGPAESILTPKGINDGYVMMLDRHGDLIWVRQLGAHGIRRGVVHPLSLAVDSEGGVVVAGNFTDEVDLDPGDGEFILSERGASGGDGFVLKLDAQGEFEWAIGMGSSAADRLESVAVDRSGMIYAAGSFALTALIGDAISGTEIESTGAQDAVVLKLTADGTLAWAADLGGLRTDRAHSVAVDDAGDVYATGEFQAVADFDPGPGVFLLDTGSHVYPLSYHAFLAKLSSDGAFRWAGQGFGGGGVRLVRSPGGGVLWAGTSGGGGIDLGPAAGECHPPEGLRGFAAMVTPAGEIESFVALPLFVWARGMAIDARGRLVIGGDFSVTRDFGVGGEERLLTSAGLRDIFANVYDREDVDPAEWCIRPPGLQARSVSPERSRPRP